MYYVIVIIIIYRNTVVTINRTFALMTDAFLFINEGKVIYLHTFNIFQQSILYFNIFIL